MQDRPSAFAPAADVVFTRITDEEGVLLHLRKNQFFSLNETGLLIWDLLGQACEICDVSAAIVARYEVDDEAARGAVERLVEQLVAEGLLCRKQI